MHPSYYTPHDAKILQSLSTPTQWQQFWIEKLLQKMVQEKIPVEHKQEYQQVIKEFLQQFPGNPRSVSGDMVKSFLRAHSAAATVPLLFFFEHVAFSVDLQNVIKAFSAAPEKQAVVKKTSPAPAETTVPCSAESLAILKILVEEFDLSVTQIQHLRRDDIDLAAGICHAGKQEIELSAQYRVLFELFLRQGAGKNYLFEGTAAGRFMARDKLKALIDSTP